MKPEKLRELLRSTMRDNPKASEREIHDLCLKKTSADAQLQIALFEYWFANSYRDFTIAQYTPHSAAVLAVDRSRGPNQAERQRATADLKNQMKICLLDHLLSDGTPLRDATFGQCAREAGWLHDISKCGKANEVVGKKLTEKNLSNLLKRHAENRASAA